MVGNFHMKVGGTVAIAVTAVVFIVLLILWISRKATRGSLRNTRRMFRRSKGTRLPDHADIAMVSFNERHGYTSSSARTICSISASDNNPANPKQSPSLPSHACMSDIGTQPSHSSPMHRFSNSGMITRESDLPTDDRHKATLQSSGPGVSSGMMETLPIAPITDVVHSHALYDEGRFIAATLTGEALGTCTATRLKYSELRVQNDIAGISYISAPEESDILSLDVEESDSGMSIVMGHHDTSNAFLSMALPPEHSLSSPSANEFRVPEFSSIPLSLNTQTVNPGTIFTRFQFPSPPPTPSTYSMPSHTTEIVRESDVPEDVKTWSDVLSFTEYEREDYLHHTQKVFSLKSSLPSPPPTPTVSSTAPFSENTMLPEAKWLSGRTIYDKTLNDTLPIITLPPKGHEKVSYVQTQAKALIPNHHEGMKEIDIGNGDRPNSEEALPPYECFGFDYETRLALKRATSLLAKPVKPRVSTARVLRQVASARPRPPAAEYEPLLLRKTRRSRIKTQKRPTGHNKSRLGFGSTSLTGSKTKTGLANRKEISPHVKVLEMLIEDVSEPRTGDIALGTL